jgi:hypothetical protein
MRVGATVKLRVAGRGGERNLKLKLAARQDQAFVLQDTSAVSPEQLAHRAAWIHGDNENEGAQ